MRVVYKNSGMLIGIARCLKYLAERRELLNILLLSKNTNKILKAEVYNQVLLRVHLEFTDTQRLSIWSCILQSVSEFNYRIVIYRNIIN